MAQPWPATLPGLNELDGYQESPPDTLLRQNMDAGPPKVRRRCTAGVRPISGRLVLTLAQVEILDGFYVNDLADGSINLTASHPRTGVSSTFRFVSPPQYRPHRGKWQATLDIEVLP